MIKAIIFDCFGVLVGRGFSETYRLAGGDPIRDAEFIEDTLNEANRGLIDEQEFDTRMAQKLAITEDEYRTAVVKAEQLDTELLAYIDTLHDRYKTAILSNANNGVLERMIDKSILAKSFDALIISAEAGAVKPEARIYEIAAEKLGCAPEECVFIDDHEYYCRAAAAFGMQSIVYQNLAQLKADLEHILAK